MWLFYVLKIQLSKLSYILIQYKPELAINVHTEIKTNAIDSGCLLTR